MSQNSEQIVQGRYLGAEGIIGLIGHRTSSLGCVAHRDVCVGAHLTEYPLHKSRQKVRKVLTAPGVLAFGQNLDYLAFRGMYYGIGVKLYVLLPG